MFDLGNLLFTILNDYSEFYKFSESGLNCLKHFCKLYERNRKNRKGKKEKRNKKGIKGRGNQFGLAPNSAPAQHRLTRKGKPQPPLPH
jgi:hypothetical protein